MTPMGRCVPRALGTLAFGAVALVGAGTLVNLVAARRHLGAASAPGRSVVLVLGFRNTGSRINAVNRWRVRSGLVTAERWDADLVVFSGGSPGGAVEADLLADEAERLGLRRPIVRERESRTTTENLAFSAPHLVGATRLAIVSHPLHAQRARAHLWATDRDLAVRLVPAVMVREGVGALLLPVAALYEMGVRAILRHRRRRLMH